jgi:hypothetical protein
MLWLWNENVSARPFLKYVENQNHYVVDFFASEVIQWSRSYLYDGRLIRGRIWAEFIGCLRSASGKTIPKGDAFKNWFNQLAGWVRRKGKKNNVGDYLLPDAIRFSGAGGTLSQIAVADHIKIVHH